MFARCVFFATLLLCSCACASAQNVPNAGPANRPGNAQSSTEDEADRQWKRTAAALKGERFAEAEQLCRSALALCERTYGPEHLKTADVVSSLAFVLHQSGRPGEAESLFKRALVIREKELGPAHPDVAATLDEMAHFALDRLDFDQALKLSGRGLKMRVQSLGRNHRDVAYSLIVEAEIAHVASRSSKRFRKLEGQPYRTAVDCYERAIEVFAKEGSGPR